MFELGNVKQIEDALKGKTGLLEQYEEELIKRIAIVETEFNHDMKLPAFSKGLWILLVVASCVTLALLFV
ncbi:MAG: hypothetical protein PHG06_18305 [Parabacteroides sp.]|nr:hypothetical protein [Parabacteroides sp.]